MSLLPLASIQTGVILVRQRNDIAVAAQFLKQVCGLIYDHYTVNPSEAIEMQSLETNSDDFVTKLGKPGGKTAMPDRSFSTT